MDTIENTNDESAARLEALGKHLATLRDSAVKARASSGIENEWLEDEEYFQGIDDTNRSETAIKPTSPDGRVRIERSKSKTRRSTVFVNITRPYVNAAAAKVGDMLLPTDEPNYTGEPTPIPDLIKQAKSTLPVLGDDGQPQMTQDTDPEGKPVMAEVQGPNGQMMQQPKQRPLTNGDIAKQELKKAEESCEKAFTQIDDWLTEGSYHGEVRQVIEDAARIGTGVLKGPFPHMVRRRAVIKALNGIGIQIKEELIPCSRRISVWNLYPEGSCGENIHNGKYIFEEDRINGRQLSDLKKEPNYIKEAIDKVIEVGPVGKETKEPVRERGAKANDKEMYSIWYYHGYLSRKELKDAGYEFDDCQCKEEKVEETSDGYAEEDDTNNTEGTDDNETEESGEPVEDSPEDDIEDDIEDDEARDNEQVPAMVVMVNDVVIKATMSVFDSGEFPYDVMPWQKRAGHWAGIGVARQMRTSQDGVNAATRNLMDNAGISGKPILIIDRTKIEPAGDKNDWTLYGGKVFYTKPGVEVGNVRDAITWVLVPSMQSELMNIIQMWMQRAEDETGLPMLLQGQQGKAPDTFGGMQMLYNNASSGLRRIARMFDSYITEPHIGRYYEYLLIHGEDDSAKGDYTIKARGSSALVEREAHAQVMMQLIGASINPAYGVDPELVMAEFLKSQRIKSESVALSEEKKQAMASRQPPPDPAVQVAQIRSQDKEKELAAKAQNEQQRLAFEAQQADMDRQMEQTFKNIDAHIHAVEMDGDKQMNAQNLKVALTKELTKLRTQVALSRQSRKATQVATPAFEPPGRAPDGEAYQK